MSVSAKKRERSETYIPARKNKSYQRGEVQEVEMSKEPKGKKSYAKGPIPYAVSQPKRFWRIKKDLPAADYWKKRYWRRRITGRGDYTMNANDSFGRRYGGLLGAKLGEFAGGGLQTLATSLMGLGDYTVRKNVLLSGRLPQISNLSSGGGTVIRFQEYLGDVFTAKTPGDFSINSYLINAANEDTFPFLSQLAANYEQYEMEGCVFQFMSTSADALNSVNTALGSVMMATQYDVADEPFTNKLEMLNYEFSTSCKPSVNTLHMIECDPRQTTINELYCLNQANPPPFTDPRLYHLGRFQIATTGFQGSGVNIGQLHVTYQVKLLKPKLFTRLGETNQYAMFSSVNTYSNTSPFLGLVPEFNNIPIELPLPGNTIVFNEASADRWFRVELDWFGTAALTTLGAVSFSTGVTITTGFAIAPLPTATSSQSLIYIFGIKIAAHSLSPTITIGPSVLPTGINRTGTVRVIEAPSTSGGV